MKRGWAVWAIVVTFGLCAIFSYTASFANYGISLGAKLKYPPDFRSFGYTSDRARKGGSIALHDIGSFDKINPFTLKGQSPLGVEWLTYDPLAVQSLDEPFALYGLIASDIRVSTDNLAVTFTLNPEARFSDNHPIRAHDVAYTLKMLKSEYVHPYYNYYYRDIERWEILSDRQIRFHFSVANRELPLIASQIRILPAHRDDSNGFVNPGLEQLPISSGPYKIARIIPGKAIFYQRIDTYWAKNHPTRKNMFNFDQLAVKYYKDQTVALEAFKAGEFDFLSINIAKQWARDMKGKRFSSGKLLKARFPHSNGAGMQGFLMNTRRELFADRKVRKALGLALDFSWINRALFHGQYTRTTSFFSNSSLAARGLPSKKELELLEPFRDKLPDDVFTTDPEGDLKNSEGPLRKKLLKARSLLSEAGWKVRNGILTNLRGRPYRFQILLVSRTFERVMASYVQNLKRLGIVADYRTIDPALYMAKIRSFDFDMIVASYGQSQSPGNEQRNFWTSEAALREGSRNYAGIRSPVVDALVDRIVYAVDRDDLVTACRALDRVLWFGYYLVPNWYLPYHRLGFSARFDRPQILPTYYNPDQLLMTWWVSNDQNNR